MERTKKYKSRLQCTVLVCHILKVMSNAAHLHYAISIIYVMFVNQKEGMCIICLLRTPYIRHEHYFFL